MAGATVADGFRAVGSRERRSFSNEWMACRGFETFHQKNDDLFEKSHKIRPSTRSATDFVRFFAQNATEKPEYQIFLMQFHTKFPSPRWTARIDRIA